MTCRFVRACSLIVVVLIAGCSHPFQSLDAIDSIAIVSVNYNTTMHHLDVHQGILNTVFSDGDMTEPMRRHHEVVLNEFLVQFMQQVNDTTTISLSRPARLVNTSLMHSNNAIIQYEYLLEPYDPIDIRNRLFMSGLAKRLNVMAVMRIDIQFGIWIDATDLWDDMSSNTAYRFSNTAYKQALSDSHESSIFRTQITIDIVDTKGNLIVSDTSHVDVLSDDVSITNLDLAFPGNVSPRLIEKGLTQWLQEWLRMLPESTLTKEGTESARSY